MTASAAIGYVQLSLAAEHVLLKRGSRLSPLLTNPGRAETFATFGPCVKSMETNFISLNAQFSSHMFAL